jgi:hypothetical protein
MDDIPLEIRNNVFFQQDGAPAHNAIVVREYLQNKFGNRWMGIYRAAWPPRSPDLTPLDFFFVATFEECSVFNSTFKCSIS